MAEGANPKVMSSANESNSFPKGPDTLNKRPPYQNRTSTHQKQNTYTQNQANDENENFAESSSSNRRSHSSGNRKKIFDEDEGEYVDYEEVK